MLVIEDGILILYSGHHDEAEGNSQFSGLFTM